MNEKSTKIAAPYFHSVYRGEDSLSVIAGVVLGMKHISKSPGKRCNVDVLLLISSLYLYETTLNYSSGNNRQQNRNTICESLLFLYLTGASVLFQAILVITIRAKTKEITVPTLMSFKSLIFDIRSSGNGPPLNDTAISAVRVHVNLTTSGSDFNSNWSPATCFPSSSANIQTKN